MRTSSPGPVIHAVNDFKRETSGSIATIFAFAFLGLTGMVGMALDYTRYQTIKTDLQASADTAVIAAAVADKSVTTPEEVAQSTLTANWATKARPSTATITVQDLPNNELQATAKTSLPTTFMKILGFSTIDIEVISSVVYGQNQAEVALALDTTGSMSGQKLSDLKSAARLLVDTAYAAPGAAARVQFSVVPFARYVNVGTMSQNAPWMSVPANSSSTSNVCSTTTPVTGTSNCTTQTATYYDDGVLKSYQYQQCDYTYGPPVTTCSNVTTTTTWNGCAGSRTYPANTQKVVTSGNPVPGIMNVSCPSQLQRLTKIKPDIYNAIDGLVATGETYIPAGLVWGWRTLSSEAPFADGAASSTSARKVLVLMTDGTNTASPNYPDHEGSNSTTADTLTTELCTNIKADKVTVFTVAFAVTDTAIKDRLKACASSEVNFFDATNSTELTTAFEKIGRTLAAMYIKR